MRQHISQIPAREFISLLHILRDKSVNMKRHTEHAQNHGRAAPARAQLHCAEEREGKYIRRVAVPEVPAAHRAVHTEKKKP